MELKLDNREVEVLRATLENAWRDLRYEIADTDNPTFKRQLEEREAIIKSIIDRLAPAKTTTAHRARYV
jgi:hypothetical protein